MFALSIAIAIPAASASGICGRDVAVMVLPNRGVDAPLNTHVFVRLPSDWRTKGFCSGDEPLDRCVGADLKIVLRTAPEIGKTRSTIAVDQRESISGISTTIELVPKAPLSPKTAYEVWSDDRHGRSRPRILGAFTTGTLSDTVVPVWTGLTTAALHHPPPRRPGVIVLTDECGAPKITLETTEPTGGGPSLGPLRAAIWIVGAKETLDYTKPPRVYESITTEQARIGSSPRTKIEIGSTEPDFDDLGLSIDGGPLRVGVKIVDLAGHMSAPSELIAR